MITAKTLNNANKIAYLIGEYPKHTMPQIVALLEMPAIDINTGIWAAVELGWILDPKTNEGVTGLLQKPETWDFGAEQQELEDKLVYAFEKLNESESDIEEFDLSTWTAGYSKHDLAVTMLRLLNEKVLFEYQFQDTNPDNDSMYTFYTLYKNRDKKWGEKQYKDQPAKEEK